MIKGENMNEKSGNCKLIKFTPSIEINEQLQMFAESFFDVVTNDYGDDGKEQLVGYMRIDVSEDDMCRSAAAWGLKLPPYDIEILENKDWLSANVIEFAPVKAADFLVYGVHEQNIKIPCGKIGIKIYAATAFGSEHQTTVCCLKAIAAMHKKMPEAKKFLDVGSGSGILSIAAAKRWKNAFVNAVDIDDEAVKVTAENAADNAVLKQINAFYSNGFNNKNVIDNAPYDGIFANILARPLIEMAADMANCLKIEGYAVISGFIAEQIDWVLKAYEKYGLKLEKMYAADNWRAALLKKVNGNDNK